MNVVLVVVVDALLIKMASGSGVSLGLLGFGRTCEHDLEPLKNQVPRGRLNPTGHLDFSNSSRCVRIDGPRSHADAGPQDGSSIEHGRVCGWSSQLDGEADQWR